VKVCYLYCLNFPNGKKYIGQSVNPRARFNQHGTQAKRGGQFRINRAIRKHGLPKQRLLCIGTEEYISALEITTIAAYRTRDYEFGYNMSYGGDISPNRGKTLPAEWRANISAGGKGRLVSDETRTKCSAARKGIPQPKNRHPKSAQMRTRLSAARTGVLWSEEAKAKMSASAKRRKASPETRAKLSAARKGVKRSPETRAKLAIALTKARAARSSPSGARIETHIKQETTCEHCRLPQA
jgi:hypothetical protein